MSLLIPLGLLGLLGLLILLLIYILKPNYQQKLVSSTFVWKLSLKYKKRRIPISKLRNLLILLCQIIIICCGALIMAQPALVTNTTVYEQEKIAIIDASASMNSSFNGETRFQRAVGKVQALSDSVIKSGGYITVILAGNTASYVCQRATSVEYNELIESLDTLECCYGEGDIEGAIALAEETLQSNSDAEVIMYTATKYTNEPENITIEDCSVSGEWNVAILNVDAKLVDNYYAIEIDIACYGRDDDFVVNCSVLNPNGRQDPQPMKFPSATARCSGDEVRKVVYAVDKRGYGDNVDFVALSDNNKIYSFDQLFIEIPEYELVREGNRDSVAHDNEFYVYGGSKPTVKVEYYSTLPNNFISGSLMMVTAMLSSRWNIEVTEVTSGTPETSGYDIYIFEHATPSQLPSDGVVFLIDPSTSVNTLGAGFTVGRRVSIPNWDGDGAELAAGKDHPILNNVDVGDFRLTEYIQISEESLDNYDVLMYYEGNPVFILKDEPDRKIAALSFNIHKSNFNLSYYFPILIYNFFDYFLPSTFEDSVYDVYQTVELNSRAGALTVTDNNKGVTHLDAFPAEYTVTIPGTYIVKQTLLSGNDMEEKFYVRIPASQSNINKTEDILAGIQIERTTGITYDDLLLYFAAAILALLILEYFLQSRSGI